VPCTNSLGADDLCASSDVGSHALGWPAGLAKGTAGLRSLKHHERGGTRATASGVIGEGASKSEGSRCAALRDRGVVTDPIKEWARTNPRAARSFKTFVVRQANDERAWHRRRRAMHDQVDATIAPRSQARKQSGQMTSLRRGAKSLLSPIDRWSRNDGSVLEIENSSSLRRQGPGRAATMAAPGDMRADWNRAEFAWAAAILHLDFLAVYRELREAAPSRATLNQLVEAWPKASPPPLTSDPFEPSNNDFVAESHRREPMPSLPPRELLRTLNLVSHVGSGAHLLRAEILTLDLDLTEREGLSKTTGLVRDLPESERRRLLDVRDRQIHVRRIPALPPERGRCSGARSGTALARVTFGGHALSGYFSHTKDPVRRVVDIVSENQCTILYGSGPDRAAFSATSVMLDRSPTTIRRVIRQARALNLVTWENTRQAQ
jgi:hypothetical protein